MKTVSALVATAFLATTTFAFAADPTQTDFDACNRMAQSKVSASASPQTSASATTQSGSSTGSTQQAAPSPQSAPQASVANQADQLRGIADASKDDPAYQQAYRECLKGRGF